ncbi:MAG: hypothetical protein K0S32_3607 [Bacteroidetes bacterium]|jgi:hypothetical protein|nr:hypothetical protein [Bacteroidota bacterium]
MKIAFKILLLFLASFNLNSQISYSGFIGKYPIELVTEVFSDGIVRAIYAYSNYDEPIIINGILKQKTLILFEKDKNNNKTASLTFENFDAKNDLLEGTWKDLRSNKQFTIKLTKKFDIDHGEAVEWKNREIIQTVCLKDHYFRLIISKKKGEFFAKVSGVKIMEKKTDKLIQQIDLDCQLWGLANISVDDYNFDGIMDFSLFENSYAGPNTTSLYFLFNPKTNSYFNSGFTGTSLGFDKKTKTISEHNQCCAGKNHMSAEYKVVNNKMVLIKKSCIEFDEKTQDYKTVKCD